MLKFIGKALSGMVLTKEGKQAAAQLAAAKQGKPIPAPPARRNKPKQGEGEEVSDEIRAFIEAVMEEARNAVRAEMTQDAIDNARSKLEAADIIRAKAAAAKSKSGGGTAASRATLISNALSVHKAKQAILKNLSDEQRAKLVALAMKTLLNEGRSK